MNEQIKLRRAVWLKEDKKTVQVIDQRHLPFKIVIEDLKTVDDATRAIKEMHVRGTGGIGSTAAYGMYLATLEAPKDNNFDDYVEQSAKKLINTRPTAIDLVWAVERQLKDIKKSNSLDGKISASLETANKIVNEYMECSRKIGEHGLKLIEDISKRKNGETVNILTHCNAGWLGLSDYGTAPAPIYMAFDKGIKVHVWVDETRPRNQGARLTAWEFEQYGIPYTVIVDNVGGHLMQHGLVDLVIVGTDRTTYTGDVANKIGTYLKALAAKDNNIPFYVALPSSSIDWKIRDGVKEIPIEERDSKEVKYIQGLHNGSVLDVLLMPENSPAANYGFDVTPARLVTGLITERGICEASEKEILKLFPEFKKYSN